MQKRKIRKKETVSVPGTTENLKLKLLFVDDEKANLTNFKMAFEKEFDVFTAISGKEGLKILAKEKDIALIVTDQRMPEMTGVDFLKRVSSKYPETVRMILSAYTDSKDIITAVNYGEVFRYFVKPWDYTELKKTLRKAAETYLLSRKNRELLNQLKGKRLSAAKLNRELSEWSNIHSKNLAQLEATEIRYRAVVELASDAIVTTNSTGEIVDWNKGAVTVFGYTPKETLGQPLSIIFPRGHKTSHARKVRQLVSPRKSRIADQIMDITGQKKDGAIFPLELTRTTWKSPEGNFSTLIMRDVSGRREVETDIKQKVHDMEVKINNLGEMNTAQKDLILHREEERKEMEKRFLTSIKKLVVPYVNKLRSTDINSTQGAFLTIIESNLTELLSPLSANFISKYMDLTPKEIQIAGMIKEGKTNREIAEKMGVSLNTVLFHRFNMRKKLGLLNQKINLKTYLTSIPV